MTSTCDLQLVGLIASSDVASAILSHMNGGLVVMVLMLCVLRCLFRSLSNSDVSLSLDIILTITLQAMRHGPLV
jgi:hypothetical protein